MIRKRKIIMIMVGLLISLFGAQACSTEKSKKVIPDTIPPVITILGKNPLNLQLDDTFTDPGASAVDDVDGDVTASIQTSDDVDTSVVGTYSVTYTITNTAGNTATANRTVLVSTAEKSIKIGWSEIDITPTGDLLPIDLRGQMHARITSNVNDLLTATALAIESISGEQWILVSVDTNDLGPGGGREWWPMDHEGMLTPLRNDLQGKLLGFDLKKLTLVATHTHTAPYINETTRHFYPTQESIQNNPYYNYVKGKLEQVIQEAWNNRAYGGLSFEEGSAAVGFCRIVKYTDGHHEMYGDTTPPDFTGMLTPNDHTLELMYTFDTHGGLTGIMINIVSPSQSVEDANFISADFWHDVRQELKQTYGNDIFILPYGGAAGDMAPRNLEGTWATRRKIGTMIADSVRERYPFAMQNIKFQVEMGHAVRDVNLTTKSFYHTNHPVYGEPRSTYLVEIHAVRLDNTAWVNNPFELYNAWGKAIQNGSVATQTIIAQMSGLNRGGYLPTQEAVNGGAYGGQIENGWCGPIGGQQLVDHSLDMINSLFASNTSAPVIMLNDSNPMEVQQRSIFTDRVYMTDF